MNSSLDMLQLIPIFRDLSSEELERIWGITIQRAFRKKEHVFMEGDQKEAVFFIQNGLVKAYKTDENGNEHIVSFLKMGDMFPHTGFFNQNPYPASAEAIVDSKLLAIPVRPFEQLMMDTPVIAIKVMRVMGEKIKDLQEKLQEITSHDVQDRGLLFLLKLTENNGYLKNGVIHIDVPMTHQEFANTIGTTRETVNRQLNQLRKDGLVETNRKGFLILDYEALKTLAHKS